MFIPKLCSYSKEESENDHFLSRLRTAFDILHKQNSRSLLQIINCRCSKAESGNGWFCALVRSPVVGCVHVCMNTLSLELVFLGLWIFIALSFMWFFCLAALLRPLGWHCRVHEFANMSDCQCGEQDEGGDRLPLQSGRRIVGRSDQEISSDTKRYLVTPREI